MDINEYAELYSSLEVQVFCSWNSNIDMYTGVTICRHPSIKSPNNKSIHLSHEMAGFIYWKPLLFVKIKSLPGVLDIDT